MSEAEANHAERVPGLPPEDEDRLAAAEADAAYRWAAGAVQGRHVLVAGCGAGHGARILSDAGAKTVTGSDPNERAIETATRLYGERIHFLRAETAALPLATNGYDAAVLLDPPTADLDAEAAVAELGRVLAPGGVLLVSLPLPVPGQDAPGMAEALTARFEHTAAFRRRLAIAATVAPADSSERVEIERAGWLAAGQSEDRTILLAASDTELPELEPVASMVSFRDLRSQEDTLEGWEARARRAEADGSAKHWELVAAREAQRRLRMRLYELEHRPLRKLSRIIRGRPATLGSGPPLRASEIKPEHWD
jgi:SAM-dependent methyltransferase